MSHKLKVGFIGIGRIAVLHYLGYIDNPDAELVAICSRHKDKNEETAKQWKVTKTYEDYNDLINDPEIDVVEILTPHNTHFEIATAALNAKKHVSLQKVPTMTVEEFDQLVELAIKNGVHFRVYENFRFHEPYVKALEIIKSGRIGKVKVVNQRMWASLAANNGWHIPVRSLIWRMSESADYCSPVIFDDGFHKHSIAHMFLPKIKTVQALCNKHRFAGVVPVDAPTVVMYNTDESDTYGTWNYSLLPHLPIRSHYYTGDESLEITCERGLIFTNGCTGDMFTHAPGMPNDEVVWMDSHGRWHENKIKHTDWKYSFIECTKHFIKAIKEDKPAALNAEDSRRVLQITLGAVRSMKDNGVRIDIDDADMLRMKH